MIKSPFILREIRFIAQDYLGNNKAVQIRYGWYAIVDDVCLRYKVQQVDEFIVKCVKSQFPTSVATLSEINTERQIIGLRNTSQPAVIWISLIPELGKAPADLSDFIAQELPVFQIPLYSIHPLQDSNGMSKLGFCTITYHMEYDKDEWQLMCDLFKIYSTYIHPATVLMEWSLPGTLYPLQNHEVHPGDFFYISQQEVAKVISVQGSVIRMSDGQDYYHKELRPIKYTYIDFDALTDQQNRAYISFFSQNPDAEYAHQLQNHLRNLNLGEVQISQLELTKDSYVYLNIIQ